MKSRAERLTGWVVALAAVAGLLAGGAVAVAGAAELPRAGVSGAAPRAVDVGPDGWAGRVAQDAPYAVSLAAPGAAFGAPVPIDLGDAYNSSITMGPGGAALLLWTTGGMDPVLMYAYRPAGGAFGAPAQLDDQYPRGEQAPVVAFDAAGTATVAYASAEPDEDHMLVRTLAAGAATWSAPQELPAPRAFAPSLAVAPGGGAVLAWREDGPRRDATRVVATLRAPGPGATFAPSRTLGTTHSPDEPAAAINDHGAAAVAWIETQDAPHHETSFTIAAAFRTAGAPGFGKTTMLTPPGRQGASPSVSIAPDGRAVLAWSNFHLDTTEAWARVRTRSGLLRPAHRLSDHAETDSGAVALATSPALVAWYQRSHHHSSALQTASPRADGTFDAPRTRFGVPDFGDEPLVFAEPGGVVFVTPTGRLVHAAR